MLGALTALFQAATAWLTLEIKKYPQKLADEIDALEDKIIALERSADPADHLRAERLHKRLLRKRGVLADTLPAADSKSGGGGSGANG